MIGIYRFHRVCILFSLQRFQWFISLSGFNLNGCPSRDGAMLGDMPIGRDSRCHRINWPFRSSTIHPISAEPGCSPVHEGSSGSGEPSEILLFTAGNGNSSDTNVDIWKGAVFEVGEAKRSEAFNIIPLSMLEIPIKEVLLTGDIIRGGCHGKLLRDNRVLWDQVKKCILKPATRWQWEITVSHFRDPRIHKHRLNLAQYQFWRNCFELRSIPLRSKIYIMSHVISV